MYAHYGGYGGFIYSYVFICARTYRFISIYVFFFCLIYNRFCVGCKRQKITLGIRQTKKKRCIL